MQDDEENLDAKEGDTARKSKKGTKKIRKTEPFRFLDPSSPYAEYLPARFREWVPETQLA